MRPWLTKVARWGWKWRWWILIGLLAATFIDSWPVITAWLKLQFPGKTKWDWIEKVLIPIAPPAAIGFGVWFLDRNAKDREAQREENENKNQALQVYFDRISLILLEKQVISLAEAAKKLGPKYKDPLVESARDVIRAQTLAILRVFSTDKEKKSSVVRFLIESEILSSLTVSLNGANLNGANLSKANLNGAKLIGADLRGADLTRANLIGASLIRAKLIGAGLNGAKLIGAYLGGADLIRAYLGGADLIGADLNGAKLNAAYLIGADLRGADLTRAHLIGADLRGVMWDEKTTWPPASGFKSAKNIPEALKKQLGL